MNNTVTILTSILTSIKHASVSLPYIDATKSIGSSKTHFTRSSSGWILPVQVYLLPGLGNPDTDKPLAILDTEYKYY